MEEKQYCPCCGRHCNLEEPHCERGRAYIRTGTAEEVQRHSETYETMDMDSRLIMNLRDLGHMIRFLFEGKGSQKRILIILLESGSMTQRELTERLGIKPGSASEVIGKLEHAGMIQRTPSISDRRTTDISLTEAGRMAAKEAAGQRKARHQEMFSCLSEEEKRTLLELAEKLNGDWRSRYHDYENEQEQPGMRRRSHGPREHGERYGRGGGRPEEFETYGRNHGPHGHHRPHGRRGDLRRI